MPWLRREFSISLFRSAALSFLFLRVWWLRARARAFPLIRATGVVICFSSSWEWSQVDSGGIEGERQSGRALEISGLHTLKVAGRKQWLVEVIGSWHTSCVCEAMVASHNWCEYQLYELRRRRVTIFRNVDNFIGTLMSSFSCFSCTYILQNTLHIDSAEVCATKLCFIKVAEDTTAHTRRSFCRLSVYSRALKFSREEHGNVPRSFH